MEITHGSSGGGGTPGGDDTEVQFNDSGSFGGDAQFTWNKTSNILSVGAEATTGTVRAPSATTPATNGGSLSLLAGNGLNAGLGGVLNITGGNAGSGSNSAGGSVLIKPGVRDGGGDEAFVKISGANTLASWIKVTSVVGITQESTGFSAQLQAGGVTSLSADRTFDFPDQAGNNILVATTDPNANTVYGWNDTTNLPVNLLLGAGLASDGSNLTVDLPLFQTNTVSNATQNVLNLIQGTNITLTDDGLGGITIDATAGGGGVTGQATVDFGASSQEDSYAVTTVATASALSTSKIFVTPAGVATADHDTDDYQWDNISAYVANIVNGVSFDIIGIAPNGSWGDYVFNYSIS